MLFSNFLPFKQRKPREFSYKPFYYKEENDVENGATPEERIRMAYGATSGKSVRDKMEDRRHFGGGYDAGRGSRKLVRLLAILGILVVAYFVLL